MYILLALYKQYRTQEEENFVLKITGSKNRIKDTQ